MKANKLYRRLASPRWRQACWQRLRSDRGMASIEYLMILTFIVLPIGIMLLTLVPHMIKVYNNRMADFVALPFP